MTWHLIDESTGKILRTIRAESRTEATQMLGHGMVVSVASWRLDVHKFKPIETVVTDITQDQQRTTVKYQYKKGYKTVHELCALTGGRENQIRHIVDKNRIPYEVKQFGARRVKFFPPYACQQIKRLVNKNDPEAVMRKAIADKYQEAGRIQPLITGVDEQ